MACPPCILEDARGAIDAYPPQVGPVFVVVVGEHANGWVGRYVAQALQVSCSLRFCVDREVDRVPFDRERDRDEMRLSPRVDGRQASHASVQQVLPGGGTLHRTKYR